MKRMILTIIALAALCMGSQVQSLSSQYKSDFKNVTQKIKEARAKGLGTPSAMKGKVVNLQERLDVVLAQNPELGQALGIGSNPEARLERLRNKVENAKNIGDLPLDDVIGDIDDIEEIIRSYESEMQPQMVIEESVTAPEEAQ